MVIRMSVKSRNDVLHVAREAIQDGVPGSRGTRGLRHMAVMVDSFCLPWWAIGSSAQLKLDMNDLGSDSEVCHTKLAFLGIFSRFSGGDAGRPQRWGADLYFSNPNYATSEMWNPFQFLHVDCQEDSDVRLSVPEFQGDMRNTGKIRYFTLPWLVGMARNEVRVEMTDELRDWRGPGPGPMAAFIRSSVVTFKACLGEALTVAEKLAAIKMEGTCAAADQLPKVRHGFAQLAFGYVPQFTGSSGAAFEAVVQKRTSGW